MKRLTLFLTVTSFTIAASAQQDDFFDIQKHLQKKRKENKPAIQPLLAKPLLQNKATAFQLINWYNQRKLSHLLENGDKIYLLSQDNMPCIIPDMKQFNTPNVSKRHSNFYIPFLPKNTLGAIPNAASQHKIIITK